MATNVNEILSLLAKHTDDPTTTQTLEKMVDEAIDNYDKPIEKKQIKVKIGEQSLTLLEDTQALKTKKFGSIEHLRMGDIAFGIFLRENDQFRLELREQNVIKADDNNTTILIDNQKAYTAGQINALAGDFFGVVGNPISQEPSQLLSQEAQEKIRLERNSLELRKKRFMQSFNEFSKCDAKVTNNILAIIDEEGKQLDDALKNGKNTVEALNRGDAKRNAKYYLATLSHCSADYISLSADNQDHFHPDNYFAYEAGHALALEYATQAAHSENALEKTKYLRLALAVECYAMHFEQDAFSSGHLNVPRKELADTFNYQLVPDSLQQKLGGLMSKAMHDENNEHGVEVTNADDTAEWTAYGDEHFYIEKNEVNKKNLAEALHCSFTDILDAYRGKEPTHGYKKYWPKAKPAEQQKAHQPLFKVEDKIIKRRKDIKNITSTDYISNWNSIWTYLRRPKDDDAVEPPLKKANTGIKPTATTDDHKLACKP